MDILRTRINLNNASMKKTNFWNRFSTAVLAFAALALGACVDDDEDKGMPRLEVSPETLVFAADGTPQGPGAFTVRSNRPWTLEVDEGGDWVTPSVKQGDGNGTVEITIPASNTGRIAKLTFSLRNSYGAYLTREVTIEQGQAPRAGEVSALDIHELTPDGMEIIIELGVCRYDQFGTVVERGVE